MNSRITISTLLTYIILNYTMATAARLDFRSDRLVLGPDSGVKVNDQSDLSDPCPEHDNITITATGPVTSPVTHVEIIASHPLYTGEDTSTPDFSGCSMCQDFQYRGPLQYDNIWDNGNAVVQICNDPNWWRGEEATMIVTIGEQHYKANQLILYKKIPGENSIPQYFVLYQDGNMRLKPLPQKGVKDVKFGSSVILGPVSFSPNGRPYAAIQEVIVHPEQSTLEIRYRDGGSAIVNLSVNRKVCKANIQVKFDTINKNFITFRSMYVSDKDNDVSNFATPSGTHPITESSSLSSENTPWIYFYRSNPGESIHNPSAPNILLRFYTD